MKVGLKARISFAQWNWIASPLGQPFFQDIKNLIETAFDMNDQTKVVLMGHSSGPFMIQSFLASMPQDWKSKYVQACVTVSGEWAGQGLFISLSTMGWNPLNYNFLETRYISETWLNVLSQYPAPLRYGDQPVLQTPLRNYSASQVMDIFHDAGLEILEAVYPVMQKVLPNPYPTHPGVNLYCLYGSGFPTVIGPVYNTPSFNVMPSGNILVNGDTNQEYQTNTACLEWANSTTFSFLSEEFPGITHGGMASDPGVLSRIVHYCLNI